MTRSLSAFLLLAMFALATSCYADDTPRYDVLAEYIRVLVETKNNEDIAKQECASSKKGGQQGVFSAMIRNGTRVKLRLSAAIGRLQNMHLSGEFADVIPTLSTFYSQKMALYGEMVDTATTFMSRPQPRVDYGKLAAHMAETTPKIEYVDESIFKNAPKKFALVISDEPDSQNHLSHLSITRAQTNALLSTLQRGLGSSMDAKDQNWTVSAASVLRTYLRDKGYKYSDDPWN